MVNQPQFDVFLAHNSQDKPQVRAIATKLKDRGLKYWIDEEQIPPGRWFQDVIQQAIPNVKSAAICIGTGGLGKWQAVELRSFISQCVNSDIPVIPVLLPGVKEIPEHLFFLKELNWVNFANGIEDIKALDNLEWGITGERRDSQGSIGLESNVPQTSQSSRSGGAALQLWQEKLAHLEQELAIASNAVQKFELKKHIQECKEAIDRLK
jgi:hypothetical protein